MHSYLYPKVLLIQFAKAAVAGRVKTRMIPALGEQGACRLHIALTKHIFLSLQNSQLAKTVLYSNNPNCPELKAIVNEQEIQQQRGDNLGERMANAFADFLGPHSSYAAGNNSLYDSVILMGSDCPSINKGYIQQAISALAKGVDIVLGPANDGGYVLVAMSKPHRQIFECIDWGSAEVFTQTLNILEQQQLSFFLLPPLADIDRPEDLALLAPLGISVDS